MPMTNKFHHSMWPERRRQRLQESLRDWASPFVNKPSPLLRPPLPLLQVLTFLPCPLGLNPRHYRWQPGCRSDARHLKRGGRGGPACRRAALFNSSLIRGRDEMYRHLAIDPAWDYCVSPLASFTLCLLGAARIILCGSTAGVARLSLSFDVHAPPPCVCVCKCN